jgi:membrane fusion protein, copper/silver efflux system
MKTLIAMTLCAALVAGCSRKEPAQSIHTTEHSNHSSAGQNASKSNHSAHSGHDMSAMQKATSDHSAHSGHDMSGMQEATGDHSAPSGQDMSAMQEGIAGRAPVELTNAQEQLINIRVAPVERAEAVKTVRAVGYINYDDTKVADLNSKVKGWVEKLYVDKPGQAVKAGEPLMALYSPDLYSAQQEYLLAEKKARRSGNRTGSSAEMRKFSSENNQAADTLLRAARKRLELWDISDKQIEALEKSGTAKQTLELTAPMTGVVMEKNVLPAQMINPGMLLYRIADLSDVWLDAEIYEFELPLVHVGQKASITVEAYPGRKFEGEVSFVYPYLQNKTRTAKVRLVLQNPDDLLKPGMYASVTIKSPLGMQLLVPASALFDTGERQYVFVQQTRGLFVPKEIEAGARVADNVVVKKGLDGNEQVVVDGNFLLDSESQLRAAGSSGGHHH